MIQAENRYAIDPEAAKAMDSQRLRENFHVGGLFKSGEISLVYTHYDRLMLGSVVPKSEALVLDHVPQTGTPNLLDRREMGVLNLGPAAPVTVGGKAHEVGTGEMLYVGMGAGPVSFDAPGRFYVTSSPAHRACPTRLIRLEEARRVELGARETANERVIIQFLHPDVVETCQLLQGYTQFAPGSIWNTMPAHTHDRRMESYLYFDLPADQRVLHLMGQPQETRHIIMANEEAVISPPWSIHAGAGTASYSFCWTMAGDNVDFTDMDMIPVEALR